MNELDHYNNSTRIIKASKSMLITTMAVGALSVWGGMWGGVPSPAPGRQALVPAQTDSVVDLTQLTVSPSFNRADTATFNALQVDTLVCGEFYTAPGSDLKTWRATDGSTPEVDATPRWTVQYGNGPRLISQPIDGVYTVQILNPDIGELWLAEFTRGTGPNCGTMWNLTDSVSSASGNGNTSFAARADQDSIIFIFQNDSIHRYNYVRRAFDNVSGFPILGSANPRWLQNSVNDSVFAGVRAAGDSIWVSRVGGTRSVWGSSDLPNIDEPYLEHGGNYVHVQRAAAVDSDSTFYSIDVVGDSIITEFYDEFNLRAVHSSNLFGGWVSRKNRQGNPLYAVTINGANQVLDTIGSWAGYASNYHLSSQWLHPDSTLDTHPYMHINESPDSLWGGEAISITNQDTTYIIVDNINDYVDGGGAGNNDYWFGSNGGAQMSPDGKIMIWRHDGNITGAGAVNGHYYIVELPLKPVS